MPAGESLLFLRKKLQVPATFRMSPESNGQIPGETDGFGKLTFKFWIIMVDWNAVLIVTVLCVVMPVAIVAIVFRSRNHEIDRKMDVLLRSVENGQEVDPALFADAKSSKTLKMRLLNKLVWGMVLFMTGAGMLVGAPFVDDPEGLFITGGICAAVGAALLVAFFVGRKWMKPEIESEERQMASRYGKEVEGK